MPLKVRKRPPTPRTDTPVEAPSDPQKFREAMAAFRKRVPMTEMEWDALDKRAREYAFKVTCGAQADVINDVWEAIDRAIEHGTTLHDFRLEVGAKLEMAWGRTNPARIECLVGSCLVSGAVVGAVHRRWYEGEIVEIVTSTGRNFTATTNHPMLTRRGWIGAGFLHEGDDLVGYAGEEDSSSRRDHDEAESPAPIAKIFDALASTSRAERVGGIRLDFHGDGSDRDVEIVRPNRELSIGRFAALYKPLEELIFPSSDDSAPRFCSECGHLLIVTKRCCLCDRPIGSSGLNQPTPDGAMAGAECLGKAIRAFAGGIADKQVVERDVGAFYRRFPTAREEQPAGITQATCDSGLRKRIVHAIAGQPGLSDNFRHAAARDVKFDRVLSVRIRGWRGHVFNVSTRHGYYLLDGLYTGNTIFRTNLGNAYNAGRHAVYSAPAVKRDRPYLRFDAIDDDRIDDVCSELDGTILPQDDPFWADHSPILHFNCRCQLVPLTEEEARDEGIDDEGPDVEADEGFGGKPSEDGADWEPDPSEYPDEIGDVLRGLLAD